MDELWDHAERISLMSGLEYCNHNGDRMNIGSKQGVVDEAVSLYLLKHRMEWVWLY